MANNHGGYRLQHALQQTEEALLFEKALREELQIAVEELESILDTFNACMTGANVDKAIYQFCFDYLGIKTDPKIQNTSLKKFYNQTAANEVEKACAKFIENVFPEDSDNFRITANDECIDKIAPLYPNVPKEEVRNRFNELLLSVTMYLKKCINDSNFPQVFFETLKCSLVRQFDLLIQPTTNRYQKFSDIVFKQIAPFSIAYDYNDEREIIGVYRTLDMKTRDVKTTFPDFDFELLKDKKPRDCVHLKECCFLKFIETLKDWRWVYLLIKDNDKIGLIRLLKFNPFITFCETLPLGSNVGRGKLFSCFTDITRAETESKLLDDVLDKQNKPPVECVEDKITNLRELGGEIKPESIVKVTERGVVNPIPLIGNPQPIAEKLLRTEENIKNRFTVEHYERDPRETATATTVNISREVAFLSSTYGKVIKPFIFQIVQKTLFISKETGALKDFTVRFFNEAPMTRLPEMIFTNVVRADEALYADTFDWFVDTLIETFSDMGHLQVTVLSNLGMKQKYEGINKLVSMLATLSQMTGLPPNQIISTDRFISKISEDAGLDQSLFLTLEEKEQMREQLAQLAQQQAEMGNG